MEYVIGVDIGTTSTKAIAFDVKGNIITEKKIGYPILAPKFSWNEQKPEEILKAVLNSIKYIVDKNKSNDKKLKGISFSSQMHSIIAMDKSGNNLTNCIIWADTRSKEYSNRFRESKRGHKIYMRTGTPIHPMAPLYKIMWLRDNMPEIFKETYKFVSIKSYIFYKFFGKYIVDYSIASATGLFNIYELKWDEEALMLAGITKEELPVPVSTEFIVRNLKDEIANYLEIDKDVPFVIGASDGCLANLGTNAIRPGHAAITIGTSGAIRVMSSTPKSDDKGRIFCYILTKNHYILGGPSNNGGILLQWFRENFYSNELKQLGDKDIDTYKLLINEASEIPAGSDGLIFLPYLLGERAPYWDANAKGVFFGININHTRGHFVRAILEGVVYGIYSIGKALESVTGGIDLIYATGGFVKSPLWVQILADVFNKKVMVAKSHEGSCLGAAALGMKSIGLIKDLSEIKKMVSVSKIFEPNNKNHGIYRNNYQLFSKLYSDLKDNFKLYEGVY